MSCLRAWLETYRRVFRPGTRRRAQLAGPWASVGGVDVLVVQGPGQRGDPAAALVAPHAAPPRLHRGGRLPLHALRHVPHGGECTQPLHGAGGCW